MTRKTIIEFPFNTGGQVVGFAVSVIAVTWLTVWIQRKLAEAKLRKAPAAA